MSSQTTGETNNECRAVHMLLAEANQIGVCWNCAIVGKYKLGIPWSRGRPCQKLIIGFLTHQGRRQSHFHCTTGAGVEIWKVSCMVSRCNTCKHCRLAVSVHSQKVSCSTTCVYLSGPTRNNIAYGRTCYTWRARVEWSGPTSEHPYLCIVLQLHARAGRW